MIQPFHSQLKERMETLKSDKFLTELGEKDPYYASSGYQGMSASSK